MRFNQIAPLTLAFLLAACAEPASLLNSERIYAEFGNFGIRVLSQTNGVRRTDLFSTHNSLEITRTYAVVLFDVEDFDMIGDEHAQILGGGSIGETFKSSGWEVGKRTRHVGAIGLESDPFEIATMMHLESPRELALHVYQLQLRKDSQSLDYATIVEIHHPDYLDVAALQSLYPLSEQDRANDGELQLWTSLLLSRDDRFVSPD